MKIDTKTFKTFLDNYDLSINDFNNIMIYYSANGNNNIEYNIYRLVYGFLNQVLDIKDKKRNKENMREVLNKFMDFMY